MRQRKPRPFAISSRPPRVGPKRRARPLAREDGRRPRVASADGAILSLLSDVLIGDSAWTLAEVRRLVVVRDLAELGRWRAAGLDDGGAPAQ